jgi:hypothetical protein
MSCPEHCPAASALEAPPAELSSDPVPAPEEERGLRARHSITITESGRRANRVFAGPPPPHTSTASPSTRFSVSGALDVNATTAPS